MRQSLRITEGLLSDSESDCRPFFIGTRVSTSVIEEKKTHIEKAARELFIKRGFHTTSTREIAARAGGSLGNLYNYYRTKEDLPASRINGYQKTIDARLQAMLAEIREPFEPEELMRFGERVRSLVNSHADYWLLMYIDVLEFENEHFRKCSRGSQRNCASGSRSTSAH